MGKIVDDYRVRMLSTKRVLGHLEKALAKKQPFAMVRWSHAEVRLLSHVLGIRSRLKSKGFLPYCGVSEEAFNQAATELLEAYEQADIIGPGSRADYDYEFPLTQQILEHTGLVLPPLICSSRVNRQLVREPSFLELLKKYKIIIIGRRAEGGKRKFNKVGINVVGTYNIDNYREIDQVLHEIKKGADFDLALIAAGINAVILSIKIKNKLGKVAIDFGHALDQFIDGKHYSLRQLHEQFYKKKNLYEDKNKRSSS